MLYSILKVRKTILREELKAFFEPTQPTALYVSLAGITYPTPSYLISRSASPFFVIEYVTSGEGYVFFDGKINRVSEGTIYFLNQGERHHYYADDKNPFSKIFLNVSGRLCERIVTSYGIMGKHVFDARDAKALFEKIPTIIRSDMNESEMQSALQGLFVEILARLSLSETSSEHSTEAVKLKSYLDENIHRLVSSKELSRVIFRSSDYCLKLFNREFSVTPYAYQIDRKIQRAKSLLAETNMSIGEIAESLGYCDLHYFSNLFYKKCGVRPLTFRKNIIN